MVSCYLDNFCAMEKLGPGEQPEHGFRFHEALEDAAFGWSPVVGKEKGGWGNPGQ